MPTASDLAYLDASALLKLVVEEPQSAALRVALGSWPRRASSRIVVVEVVRAARRRALSAERLALRLLANIALLEDDNRLLASAALSEPADLRTLDAIHLASALRLRRNLAAFVSYDERQLAAAAAAGLPVASPH